MKIFRIVSICLEMFSTMILSIWLLGLIELILGASIKNDPNRYDSIISNRRDGNLPLRISNDYDDLNVDGLVSEHLIGIKSQQSLSLLATQSSSSSSSSSQPIVAAKDYYSWWQSLFTILGFNFDNDRIKRSRNQYDNDNDADSDGGGDDDDDNDDRFVKKNFDNERDDLDQKKNIEWINQYPSLSKQNYHRSRSKLINDRSNSFSKLYQTRFREPFRNSLITLPSLLILFTLAAFCVLIVYIEMTFKVFEQIVSWIDSEPSKSIENKLKYLCESRSHDDQQEQKRQQERRKRCTSDRETRSKSSSSSKRRSSSRRLSSSLSSRRKAANISDLSIDGSSSDSDLITRINTRMNSLV